MIDEGGFPGCRLETTQTNMDFVGISNSGILKFLTMCFIYPFQDYLYN